MFFWQILPAFRTHHTTKERVWFNQAHAYHAYFKQGSPEGKELPDHLYPLHVYYGDGSEIELDVIQHIRAMSWQSAVGFRWRNGDLLAIDNMAVQHVLLTSNCKSFPPFIG